MPHVLTIAQKAPPSAVYPALIASEFINAAATDPTTPIITTAFVDGTLVETANKESTISLQVEGGETIFGSKAVVEKLLTTYPKALRGTKSDKLEDEWVTFSLDRLGGKDFKATTVALGELNDHLTLRSFLVGYTLTIADLAVFGALRGNQQAWTVVKKATYINLWRWFKFVDANETVAKGVEILQSEAAAKKKVQSSTSNFEIDLRNTEKGVVTRFPPEPSGYLHIGHAKAAMLNQYFAQTYKGKLIIRFDDTNPSKEKAEFQDSILEDLALLGIHGDVITYTSDYFQQLYEYCEEMIKTGKAYVDDTEQMTMRAERMDGIASKRRERPVEESLQIFREEMSKGTELGQKNCVRAKLSVDSPNKALRDPVIYRCNPQVHHRTGDKWKAYPTYDFACPIVDCLEGVTHALRTMEYRDRNDQYWWMLKALNLRKVEIWDFARLNFVKTLLSKRKLTWFVDQGLVTGWDDPRFPTVRGIHRRGMTVEGLRQFILAQGPSKNVVNLDWTIFWATNKKIIDPIAPRYTAMFSDDVVTAKISGAPAQAEIEEQPKHKKNLEIGNKKVYKSDTILIDQVDAQSFKDGEEITLMSWGNAIVEKIIKNASGIVTAIDFKLHLEGDFKKTEKKITWLSTAQELIDVELVDFDYLIIKDKLEEDDKVENFLTKETEFRVKGVADCNVKELKADDIIQFERKGYYRLDRAWAPGAPAVFFNIPTGKDEKKAKK